jgi:hypothetical protein
VSTPIRRAALLHAITSALHERVDAADYGRT